MSHFMGAGIFRTGLNRTDLSCWRLTLICCLKVSIKRQNLFIAQNPGDTTNEDSYGANTTFWVENIYLAKYFGINISACWRLG